MKILVKITMMVAILLSPSLYAEESGGFLGPEVGYGFINAKQNIVFTSGGGGTITQKNNGELNGGGIDAGLLGGYKSFFGRYFGLRYYANINVTYADLKKTLESGNSSLIFNKASYNAFVLNYGANIDMLINFYSKVVNDFGMFVGVAVGGSSYFGSAVDEIDRFVNYLENTSSAFKGKNLNLKLKKHFLDVALNMGLRTNFLYNHGLELNVRVPLLEHKFINQTSRVTGNTNQAEFVDARNHTMLKKPNIAVTLRYIYTFGKRGIVGNTNKGVRSPMRRQNTTPSTRTTPRSNNPMNYQYNQQRLRQLRR